MNLLKSSPFDELYNVKDFLKPVYQVVWTASHKLLLGVSSSGYGRHVGSSALASDDMSCWDKATKHALKPMEGLTLPDKEEFANKQPKLTIDKKQLFIAGKVDLYSLDLTEAEFHWKPHEDRESGFF